MKSVSDKPNKCFVFTEDYQVRQNVMIYKNACKSCTVELLKILILTLK